MRATEGVVCSIRRGTSLTLSITMLSMDLPRWRRPHTRRSIEGISMNLVKVSGHIDENHQLAAVAPESVPVGPVTVLIVPSSQEDDAGDAWTVGVAREWADELNDERQDIYTLADGEPVRES